MRARARVFGGLIAMAAFFILFGGGGGENSNVSKNGVARERVRRW